MSYTCIVKQGNLLDEENATFILNASNTTLVLGSGVSAAFRKKCGMKLQEEMFSKLLSLEQKLNKGDVIATSSSDANNFKYALHAAVMDYNQGINSRDKLPVINDIQTILRNVEPYLQWYADNHKDETVKLVLPLMGCGVGGLNKKEVLEAYKDYFKKNISFKCSVVIYAYSNEDYLLARDLFKKYTYPLLFEKKHLFLVLNDQKWLIDTGSPASFGDSETLNICNQIFDLGDNYGILNTQELSSHIGLDIVGLIGVDILNSFDILFNMKKYYISFSETSLALDGEHIPIDSFMGIPIILISINRTDRRMYFDTGAQISYFQDKLLKDFPSNGRITDFYHGIGNFGTETYLLDMRIAKMDHTVVCGSLPDMLSETLMMASVDGIISNEVMENSIVGYFPRRNEMVFKY